jgi:2-polyprenyl-3-methyl-5-hydroxy-6-metoxy-1,4-benzoquinol methylase
MGETITPFVYQQGRDTALGSITERCELQLILGMTGELGGLRVLDVGRGDGTYALAAAEKGALASGVDIAREMISTAETRAAERSLHIDFRVGSAAALPFDHGSFDGVIAVTLLCLASDLEAIVAECARVTAPGVRVVIGELGRWSLWAASRRLRGWLGSPTWRSARFWTAKRLKTLVTSVGLVVDRVEGAVYYPPVPLAARLLAPLDRILARYTTIGAAFIAVAAHQSELGG